MDIYVIIIVGCIAAIVGMFIIPSFMKGRRSSKLLPSKKKTMSSENNPRDTATRLNWKNLYK